MASRGKQEGGGRKHPSSVSPNLPETQLNRSGGGEQIPRLTVDGSKREVELDYIDRSIRERHVAREGGCGGAVSWWMDRYCGVGSVGPIASHELTSLVIDESVEEK